MHETDTRVEDRLRAALWAEADDLPFTITVDRLERRLAERGRSARAMRFAGSIAAAAAVVVVVGIAASTFVNRDITPAATPLGSIAVTSPSLPPTLTPSPIPQIGLAYACGEARFDAGLLSTPATAEQADRPDAAAVREEIANPTLSLTNLPAHGYWLVSEGPTRAVYLGLRLGAGQYVLITVEERDSHWAATDAGECRPTVVIDGEVGEATWTWDPAGPAPGPTTTTLTALVREIACAGGQSAGDRIRGPSIVVQPDRVIVGFAVLPQTGQQDCQAAQPTAVTLTLPEALGARTLVDGGVYPFRYPGPETIAPPVPLAQLPEPALPPKARQATLLLGVSGTSESVRLTRTVRVPAEADHYIFRLACTGVGTVDVEIDGVAEAFACDPGDPSSVAIFSRGGDDQLDFSISADGILRYAVAIDARDVDALPGFHVPVLTMSGPDHTAADMVTVRGFEYGCGLSYKVGGSTSVTDCGPSWQPIAAALHQRPGTQVTFRLADGWRITKIFGQIADHARIAPSGHDPVREPWLPSRDVESDEITVAVPAAGDWGVAVSIEAARGSDEFSVTYYFRIVVEP